MSTGSVDTSAAFLDTCVLLNYTLDGAETAERLFENYIDVKKVTSEKGQEEFNNVSNRRREVVDQLKDAIKSGDSLAEIDVTNFGWLSSNDEGYFGELLSELDDYGREEIIERLNEELNVLDSGKVTLFTRPDNLVTVVSIEKTDQWCDLHGWLDDPVDNENDQNLLCDATVWHRDGGSGTFVSEDASDITEATPPSGDAGTVGDHATLFDLPTGGPEDINLQIHQVFSENEELDILTTSDLLDLLE